MKSRTEAEETLDLGLLVPGIEIQVKPILIQVTFGREIQREVGTSTFGVLEDDPSSVRGILGNVVERLFPESHHSGEVVAIDDDGADSHGTAPVHPPRREFPVPDNLLLSWANRSFPGAPRAGTSDEFGQNRGPYEGQRDQQATDYEAFES